MEVEERMRWARGRMMEMKMTAWGSYNKDVARSQAQGRDRGLSCDCNNSSVVHIRYHSEEETEAWSLGKLDSDLVRNWTPSPGRMNPPDHHPVLPLPRVRAGHLWVHPGPSS